MDLIPGLPDDIGFECLARVPCTHFYNAASVCRGWKSELGLPAFRHYRKHAGLSQRVVVMVQSQVDPARKYGLRKYSAAPVYKLTVFEPGSGRWSGLPPIPGFSNGLPLFCQVVPVGYNLVVMGGLDTDNWEARNFVFVYSFLSATWRRGPDMIMRKMRFDRGGCMTWRMTCGPHCLTWLKSVTSVKVFSTVAGFM